MLSFVAAYASMERGNTIDAGEGPGPMFTHLLERLHPEAFSGNPSRCQVFLVVHFGYASPQG
jgi:hypothetical protein